MGKTLTKEENETQAPRKKSKFEGWDVAGPSRRTGHKQFFDSIFSTLPPDMFAAGTAPAKEPETGDAADPSLDTAAAIAVEDIPALPTEREGNSEETVASGSDPALQEITPEKNPASTNLLILKPTYENHEKQKGRNTATDIATTSSEISGDDVREYIDRWKRIIDGPAQLKMLEAIYVHTRTAGYNEFVTSGNHLAQISGLSLRSVWKIVTVLEKKGFLQKLKLAGRSNTKGEGSRFRFNPYP